MSHKEIQLLMSSYVDGEIRGSEELRVLEHLDVCSECRQFIKTARKIREEIRMLDEIELPYAFAVRVAHSVEKHDEQAKEWLGIEPLARNTFFAIAAVVVIMFFLTSVDAGSPPSIADVLIGGTDNDSIATQVLLQPGDLSKNDFLYAVMTK
jgi:predicted anti-sigma-YlaC factor YlaD